MGKERDEIVDHTGGCGHGEHLIMAVREQISTATDRENCVDEVELTVRVPWAEELAVGEDGTESSDVQIPGCSGTDFWSRLRIVARVADDYVPGRRMPL